MPLEGRATRMRIVFDSDWEVRLRHARLGEWHATQMVTCDSESKSDVLLGNQLGKSTRKINSVMKDASLGERHATRRVTAIRRNVLLGADMRFGGGRATWRAK